VTFIANQLLKSIVLLLAGCSSAPKEPQNLNTAIVVEPNQISSIPRAPEQPYLNLVLESAGTGHYFANKVTGDYSQSLALHNFIQNLVQKYNFSEAYLNGLFSTANRLDYVIKLESPVPSVGPVKPSIGSWTRYRDKFLTEAHINNGVQFWRDHSSAVERASATYHVDPEYIVAIIGVETYFGKNIGKTSTFDALTTLSFDTYRRSQYFLSELEHFLLMTREEGIDPRKPVGSWAGAMGLGQFMPSSFRRLAVDFDLNGRRDIWNPEDAIGSVAHYFSRSGWQLNDPVTFKSTHSSNDAGNDIELSTYQGNEYWIIHPNFKVIKKYNNSNKYAMAVHQLAKAIKLRYFGDR